MDAYPQKYAKSYDCRGGPEVLALGGLRTLIFSSTEAMGRIERDFLLDVPERGGLTSLALSILYTCILILLCRLSHWFRTTV